jgi:hypothetical protein
MIMHCYIVQHATVALDRLLPTVFICLQSDLASVRNENVTEIWNYVTVTKLGKLQRDI